MNLVAVLIVLNSLSIQFNTNIGIQTGISYTLLYPITAMIWFRYFLKKAFKSSSGSFSTGTIRKFPIVFDFSQACMGADNGVSLIKCGQTLPVEA